MKPNRDDIANKLSIVNKIIRKGYDDVLNTITCKHKEYCLSIKNDNYYILKEELMNELGQLVTN